MNDTPVKGGSEPEKKGIDRIDIPAEIDRAVEEIITTDARTDQFRSMKVLMIYQCQLLETVIGLLLPATEKKDGKKE